MKKFYFKVRWLLKTRIFNKYYWKLLLEIIKTEPFDYYYLYRIERAKLCDMLFYFQNSKMRIKSDINRITKEIKCCINCIDIFTDYKDINKNTYINTKNAYRFFPYKNMESILNLYIRKYPDEIYKMKAFNLYHEIRKRYSQTWWD